jgi:UDP-3-O-acyl N-acetylglucosamine deacetylase
MTRGVVMRRTVTRDLTLSGRGLFTGAVCAATLRPDDRGIRFVRVDVPGAEEIPAGPGALGRGIGRNTCLGEGPTGVGTIEHLMSALAALCITDVRVECRGPELPIGDGSAAPWTRLLDGHARALDAPLEPIRLTGPVRVADPRDHAARIEAFPGDSPSFEYRLDYGVASSIPPQGAIWSGSWEEYAERIAPARTFCTVREARAMRDAGLFAHLTPRDMLVLDDSPEGGGRPVDNVLRFPDEPARHKLLDLIGDLWLLGRPVLARVVAERSGHALAHELCRRIAAA